MGARLLAAALVVGLSLPARAQPSDAPTVDNTVTITVPKDSVVLDPATAKLKDAKCDADAAALAVYQAHPPLPAWAVVVLVVGAAAVGAGATVVVYELAKKPAP